MPYDAILAFSQGRELWQQDLIRRIVTQAELTRQDIADALAMLKAQHGIIPVSDAPTPVPLDGNHVPHYPEAAPPTILNSLSKVRNTNRLAEGQNLGFATDGLTIIYGDNGSGKSGYCRLAKKLCRVRSGGEEEILGNAYAEGIPPPAEVSVRYTLGEEEPQTYAWQDGLAPPEELSRISVFDEKTAPIYADKKNEVEFLPQGLDVLPMLGEACQVMARLIDTEIATVNARVSNPLPELPQESEAGVVIARLSNSTHPETLPTAEELNEICRWDDTLAQRLDETERALASDPKSLAAGCERLKGMVERLSIEVDAIEKFLGEEALAEAKSKIEVLHGARAAAELVAAETFPDEPIGHIGSDPWRMMFRYAKEFSALVYPNESFPAVGEGKVCLLCQQPLLGDSPDRLNRFATFIANKAQEQAQKSIEEVEELRKAVISFWLRAPAEIKEMLGGLEELDPESKDVADLGEAFFESLPDRRHAIIEAVSERLQFDAIPAVQPSPREALGKAAERLGTLAEKHKANQDEEQLNRLAAERNNLQARKTLSSEEVHNNILTRREDFILLGRLNACKISCDTTRISRQNSEMRREYFTADYATRLERELYLFGLDHLPLKIGEESRHGTSRVGVELETNRRVQNMHILSDGEFRALALACFLAEIGGISGHNGIIVDDPVSSLDHLRTKRVAERLIDEAGNRQVIVFTHDLVFFHELREAAAAARVPLLSHWVRSTCAGCGTVEEGEEPWQAKKVRQRLQCLEEKVAKIRRIDDLSGEEYRGAVVDFCTDLRETWERLVEECLFNDTIGRFQDGVKTQSLKGAMVEDDDYSAVFYGMKRASEYSGHDRAIGRRAALPKPDVLQREIDDLRNYVNNLRTRINNLQKRRKALEKPPTATIA